MANRYLRATGNWNGPVWAATSGGTAGSAATPTGSDWVFIEADYTVTLNENIHVDRIDMYRGRLNAAGYNVKAATISVNGIPYSAQPRLDMGSGTFEIGEDTTGDSGSFTVTNGYSVLNPNTATLIVHVKHNVTTYLALGSAQMNDVIVAMERTSGGTLNITGSPTFRSLIIQSKNSAAHEVQFDDDISVSKFIAIGSSSANKLNLSTIKYAGPGFSASYINFQPGGTSYGQYVSIGQFFEGGGASLRAGALDKAYIGANSEVLSGNGWTVQDPPKISTLVDPLTTAPGSNTNWTVSGTINTRTDGKDGGGYGISGTGVER